MTKRIVLFAAGTLIGVALLVGGLWAYRTFIQAPPLRGIAIESPRPAYDFELMSGDRAVHLSDYRGKVVALYFGYTFCPDVCPKTLSDLTLALKELGAEADGVQVLFVSVDPERDTPVRALQYAQGFNPTFVGMTGSPDDIARVAGAYGVYYQRQETPNSSAGYLVDHSATVLVIDRQGQLRTIWPFDTARDDIVNDLRSLMRQ
ncbi:MAG: SCO family protein [Anaerolineales bacterium]|nr:SCO family protein [Anaerolineales bacterium]